MSTHLVVVGSNSIDAQGFLATPITQHAIHQYVLDRSPKAGLNHLDLQAIHPFCLILRIISKAGYKC